MLVQLRDVLESDLPILFEHQIDPVAVRMAVFTPRDQPAFMTHWNKILTDATVIKRTILLDGQVVGNIVCFERAGKREVGYWIGRAHWGKGIATMALGRFLQEVKERPLHAIVAQQNPASIRVLEKCGFVMTGRTPGSPDARGPLVEEVLMKLTTISS